MPNHPTPSARLEIMTPEAQRLLGVSVLAVEPTPLRVGRGEFRMAVMGSFRKKMESAFRAADFDEAEQATATIELPEKSERRFVSQEHFEIVRGRNGYELVDLGSTLGTIVDGELVGGKRQGGRAKLADGAVIIVGSHHSGFIFRFRVDDN